MADGVRPQLGRPAVDLGSDPNFRCRRQIGVRPQQRGAAVQIDRYTKLMLTIIAACLVWLCAMTVGRPAQAQQLTAMPAALPGGAQPVVIVGWGTMDMTGRIALQLMGSGNAARTDATVPVRADRPLSVTLPYTPANPIPARRHVDARRPAADRDCGDSQERKRLGADSNRSGTRADEGQAGRRRALRGSRSPDLDPRTSIATSSPVLRK